MMSVFDYSAFAVCQSEQHRQTFATFGLRRAQKLHGTVSREIHGMMDRWHLCRMPFCGLCGHAYSVADVHADTQS